jgi:hypothetical protein
MGYSVRVGLTRLREPGSTQDDHDPEVINIGRRGIFTLR